MSETEHRESTIADTHMLFNSHTNVYFFGEAMNDGIERRNTMGFGCTACRFYDLFFDSPFRLRIFAHLSSTQMLCAQHPSDNDVRDGAIERRGKDETSVKSIRA